MNKPQNITSERIDKLETQLEQAQFTINQLDLALVLEREKYAEVQADNAALVQAWNEIEYLKNNRCGIVNRNIYGPMACNRDQAEEMFHQTLVSWEETFTADHPGAPLLEELLQLRKIRDAAEELLAVLCNGYGCSVSEPRSLEKCERWCNAKEKYLLKQALAQTKEVAK